jgi:hypothetical protein
MAITHALVATTADDPAAEINPSHWNQDHVGTNTHTHQDAANGSDLRATYTEVLAGTDNSKFATPYAIKQAGIEPAVAASGWISVSDTWVYASATTITVPSGAASLYTIGDKFKLTANSVVLQGYIIGVADTVLTVVGDSLTNHSFSAIYYSHSASPVGFDHWFPWVPTLTGGAADLPGYTQARFCLIGRTCHINFQADNKTLTGSSGKIQVTIPIACPGEACISWFGVSAIWYGGSYYQSRNQLYTTYFEISKGIQDENWVGNETVYIRVTATYEI